MVETENKIKHQESAEAGTDTPADTGTKPENTTEPEAGELTPAEMENRETAQETPEEETVETAQETAEVEAVETAQETPEVEAGETAQETPEEEAVETAQETPEVEAVETAQETAEVEKGERKSKKVLLQLRALGIPFLFWWAGILVCELVIHTFAFSTMNRFPTVVLFSAAAASVASVLTTFPTLAGKILSWLIPPFLYLIYGVQLVYHYVFDAFLSLIYVTQGGNAITQFWDIVVDAVLHCLPRLLILAVPMAAFYVLRHMGILVKKECGIKTPLILLVFSAALCALTVTTLPLWGEGTSSPVVAFRSSSATVDRWTENFGLLTAEALDLKRLTVGGQSGPSANGLDLTAGGGPARNILPGMDFEALNTQTQRKELTALNNYFNSLAGTSKNAYTGMFKGYNLIEICAESFSPYVIDPELTPTLYRLSHEGFIFENFYNSFPSVTSDGEYTLCMGTMINLKRVSFASSMDNYLPYCLGNMFASVGVHPMAYHNNFATMYNRINTHPNMGYDFKAIGFGLDMEKGHPASDLEMFEKTVDDYINDEQFHAYYMSYSGHAPYNFENNQMCIQNKALTDGIDASEEVRAYYCGELELERALTYLMERLEQAGIAERTVIVISGDHYPYGMSNAAFMELAGSAVEEDPFWRYRNSFICWNGGMEEPVVVDDYCSTQDILPTILNLFGFSYDSRLLTGRDVLADCTHAALLKDGSILTKEFLYDGSTGELTWKQEDHDEEHAQAVIEAIENQFTVAADVLDYDYYQFAFTSLDLSEGRVERPAYTSYADTAGTYYEEAGEYMARYGIIVATNHGGNLKGEDVMPRSQMVTMASRLLSLSGDFNAIPFTDVKETDWFAGPVAGVWAAGLLPEAEKFRPTAHTTKEEAVDFMTGVAEYIGMPDAAAWTENIVTEALAKQSEAGMDPEDGSLTRGAMVYVLCDMIKYIEENFPEGLVLPDGE